MDVDSLLIQLQEKSSKGKISADERKLQSYVDVISKTLQQKFSNDYPGIVFSWRYLNNFQKWHILIGSAYYCNDEFTLFTFSLEKSCVVIEFPFYIEWEQNRKIVPLLEFDSKIAEILRNCISDAEFISRLNLYKKISDKKYFVLTIFSREAYEYTNDDFRVKIYPDEVLQIKSGKKVKIKEKKDLESLGKDVKQYNGKYAVVNEILCKVSVSPKGFISVQRA